MSGRYEKVMLKNGCPAIMYVPYSCTPGECQFFEADLKTPIEATFADVVTGSTGSDIPVGLCEGATLVFEMSGAETSNIEDTISEALIGDPIVLSFTNEDGAVIECEVSMHDLESVTLTAKPCDKETGVVLDYFEHNGLPKSQLSFDGAYVAAHQITVPETAIIVGEACFKKRVSFADFKPEE